MEGWEAVECSFKLSLDVMKQSVCLKTATLQSPMSPLAVGHL